jgi:hypothetical protein
LNPDGVWSYVFKTEAVVRKGKNGANKDPFKANKDSFKANKVLLVANKIAFRVNTTLFTHRRGCFRVNNEYRGLQ